MGELGGPDTSGHPKLSAPVPLSADHDVSGFDCGVPVLDAWLRDRALKNESRFSRTYVICEGRRVVGYVCISAGSIQRAVAPSKLRRNAPDQVPVSIIGRLAISRSHAGRGLGADLLSDALTRIAFASRSLGIGAVVVQAKDEAAKRFYLACAEFEEYSAESRTLYLPIETVVAAFG